MPGVPPCRRASHKKRDSFNLDSVNIYLCKLLAISRVELSDTIMFFFRYAIDKVRFVCYLGDSPEKCLGMKIVLSVCLGKLSAIVI